MILSMRPIFFFSAVVFGLCCAPSAYAHKPLAVGQLESSPGAPLSLADIDTSQVLYYEPTAARPQIWMRFHGAAGQILFVQPGVPRIAGLEDVRPAFAVLGPGLPQVQLPFDAPADLGGLVFTSNDVAAPEAFDEPFTGTKDWQFPAQNITLPATGDYLLVAYLPNAALDKFWIAIGENEAFGLADILSLPKITVEVRQFHEIFPVGGIALIGPLLAFFAALVALVGKLLV